MNVHVGGGEVGFFPPCEVRLLAYLFDCPHTFLPSCAHPTQYGHQVGHTTSVNISPVLISYSYLILLSRQGKVV